MLADEGAWIGLADSSSNVRYESLSGSLGIPQQLVSVISIWNLFSLCFGEHTNQNTLTQKYIILSSHRGCRCKRPTRWNSSPSLLYALGLASSVNPDQHSDADVFGALCVSSSSSGQIGQVTVKLGQTDEISIKLVKLVMLFKTVKIVQELFHPLFPALFSAPGLVKSNSSRDQYRKVRRVTQLELNYASIVFQIGALRVDQLQDRIYVAQVCIGNQKPTLRLLFFLRPRWPF